ncbi:hypothetical protein JXA59_01525 [Patescibacteria group bacterium]|nr:hypothetical protein [Patescibacteria group bacterium]
MSSLNRITNYLTNPRNIRQVILIAVGLLVLGAAVLFGDEIEKLLNRPGASRADFWGPPGSELAWDRLEPGLGKERSSSQLVEVNIGAKRYLYALGGLEYDDQAGKLRLLDDVERMEISTADGSPVGGWEPLPSMYSGHAGFKAFQFGNYLYVVSGDVHIPDPAALASGSHPLLFSTIERLNLTAPSVGWEPWAKLTGVNFYPETIVVNDQLHVIGGVYGVPFSVGTSYYWGGYNLRQPLYGEEDVIKWPTYKDLPTIGGVGVGTDGVSLPSGGFNSVITVGQAVVGPNESDLNEVNIQQVPTDFAKNLSDSLLNGFFATTVSEHYILNLNGTGSSVKVAGGEGELGINASGSITSDYTGQPLVTTWTPGRVGHLAHLRFLIGSSSYIGAVYPVTQGRYGFGLIRHENGSLLVVGGASWFNLYDPCIFAKRSFWVIEDNLGPFPVKIYDTIYQYVGNVTYAYNWSTGSSTYLGWIGTNSHQQAGAIPAPPSGAVGYLPANYALHDSAGVSQGRAFFGLGVVENAAPDSDSEPQSTPLIVGGIVNSPAWVPPTLSCASGALNPVTTPRSDQLNSNGWIKRPDFIGVYGAHVTGLDYRAVVFDGQKELGDNDSHTYFRVPDYRMKGNDTVKMLSGDRWYSMLGFGDTDTQDEVRGVPGLIFGSSLDVRTGVPGGATTVYVYKAGGSTVQTSGRPNNSVVVQVLGPFTYGEGGNWSNSYLDVDSQSQPASNPAVVNADGVDYATVTFSAVDQYGDPAIVPAGTAVTLFTENSDGTLRSMHPAIRKTDKPDWIEIDGTPTSSSTWGNDYVDNFVLVDRGNDEDGNPETGLGQTRFLISSKIATDPELVLRIYAVNLIQQLSLEDYLGDIPMIFTNEGVPDLVGSMVVADPVKVVADGIATSTITVTLLDKQTPSQPVVGKKVRVFSTRNYRGGSYDDFGGSIDTITIISDVTNSNGQAIFSVRSTTVGEATFGAEYQVPFGESDYWVMLSQGARVKFVSIITSIIPGSGRQGEIMPSVRINGLQTQWNNSTQVTFSQPADVIFYSPQLDGGMGSIDDVDLWANGGTTELGVHVSGYDNRSLELQILEGGGSLRQGNLLGSTITVQTDADGKATFNYVSPTTPGILKLKATITSGTGRPTSTWWAIIKQITDVYFLEVVADPVSVTISPIQPSSLQARVYRWNNGDKFYVTDVLTINFESDDSGQLIPSSDSTGDDDNHFAYSEYRPDTTPGIAHVFVWTQFGEAYIATQVDIAKIGSAGANADITWDNDNEVEAPSHTLITLGGETAGDNKFFRIGAIAKVGSWTVTVITTEDPDSGLSLESPLVEEGVFVVEPATISESASIVIAPRSGLRGSSVELAITGTDTTFLNGLTTLSFIPPTGGTAGGIALDSIYVGSPTFATATVTIANDAAFGFWNIVAVTANEAAPMAGDRDFLVTDQNNYILDLTSTPPYELPRDGETPATLRAYVGLFDSYTGLITPVGNVQVSLEIGIDGGKLEPQDIDGNTIVTTNSAGIATATYTPDVGIENELVTITATASPVTGVFLINDLTLNKVVYPYPGFVVTAEPAELAAQPGLFSLLGWLDPNTPPPGTEVTFHLDGSPQGSITNNPSTQRTGPSRAKYVVGTNPIAEVVEFWASAIVPGFGSVRSDTGTIEVGLDPDRYRLADLTANPAAVTAGGTTTSTITARLTFNGQGVNGWPIEFSIVNGAFGDYLTKTLVNTQNGDAVTVFAPGPLPGNIIIRARALGLMLTKEVLVTKTVDDQDIDPAQSSIWATPTHLPTSTDGSIYSVVTVLLKNSAGVPLSGKTVTLVANPATALIKKGDGSSGNQGVTDTTGRVTFRVSSTTPNTYVLSTTVDGFTLSTQIIFENGLVPRQFRVVVPFQSRDYDNEVKLFLKVENSTLAQDVFLDGYYIKNSRPNNELQTLSNITVYLRPGVYYRMWVKGRYHLARLSERIIPGSDTPMQTIDLNFTELKIGDLLPDSRQVGQSIVPLPFHDNAVNVIDLPAMYVAWFKNVDIPDLLRDFMVNVLDWQLWLTSYGNGDLGGPPPYDQRL